MTTAELRALIAVATKGDWALDPEYPECDVYRDGEYIATFGKPYDLRLAVALRNHAEKFAELLEREEVGIWSAPIDGKVWLNLHRGKEHVGVIIYRKSENDYYWNAMGCGNHCSTEAEARAAVEAAVRAGR